MRIRLYLRSLGRASIEAVAGALSLGRKQQVDSAAEAIRNSAGAA